MSQMSQEQGTVVGCEKIQSSPLMVLGSLTVNFNKDACV